MLMPTELEFVLVSTDYAIRSAVSGGMKKCGAKFVSVPTAESALDCLSRRKVDGVFVDLDVPGALRLIEATRKGPSNEKAVIFACVANAKGSSDTLEAGANFLLEKPLSAEGVALHLAIAKEQLAREARRYFRHPVNLLVVLKDGELMQQAKMVNLSKRGMAVRITKEVKPSSAIEFAFELFQGGSVRGKGEVRWADAQGMAGIRLESFQRFGREYLEAWVLAQEQFSLMGTLKRASRNV